MIENSLAVVGVGALSYIDDVAITCPTEKAGCLVFDQGHFGGVARRLLLEQPFVGHEAGLIRIIGLTLAIID